MSIFFLDMEKLKTPNSGLGQFCAHIGKAIETTAEEEIGVYVDEEHLTFFETKNTFFGKEAINTLEYQLRQTYGTACIKKLNISQKIKQQKFC